MKSSTKISKLSVEDLRTLLGEAVESKLREVLEDPDRGKQLRLSVIRRLRTSLAQAQKGGRGISAREVAERLGFLW